jgi:hypothetical protein
MKNNSKRYRYPLLVYNINNYIILNYVYFIFLITFWIYTLKDKVVTNTYYKNFEIKISISIYV